MATKTQHGTRFAVQNLMWQILFEQIQSSNWFNILYTEGRVPGKKARRNMDWKRDGKEQVAVRPADLWYFNLRPNKYKYPPKLKIEFPPLIVLVTVSIHTVFQKRLCERARGKIVANKMSVNMQHAAPWVKAVPHQYRTVALVMTWFPLGFRHCHSPANVS